MKKAAYTLLFLFFLSSILPASSALMFVHPESLAIISTAAVRIKVRSLDIRVSSVRFGVNFSRESDTTIDFTENIIIADDPLPPFEIYWECKDISDQNINIYALGFDSLGSRIDSQGIGLLLDRNRILPEITLFSDFTQHPPDIDADMNDWADVDSIIFGSDDNRLMVKSLWDKKNLYFGIKVNDKYLWANPNEHSPEKRSLYNLPSSKPVGDSAYFLYLWRYDDVELCFDTRHDHGSSRHEDDVDLLIAPDGIFQGNGSFLTKEGLLNSGIWQQAVICSVAYLGTLNNNSDIDTGYIIEAAIPWQDLGLKPSNKTVIGFDVVNVDRDTREGSKLFISWSKTTWLNNDNPSEWGNLKLKGKKPIHLTSIILLGIFFMFILIILFFWTQKKQHVSVQKPDPRAKWDPHVIRAAEFIEKNYAKDLTLKGIADNISLSPNWLSEIFTRNTGTTITQYINKVRVDRAAKLLSATSESVSQIAFQVGFNNPQHFNKIFKDLQGLTPTTFRLKT